MQVRTCVDLVIVLFSFKDVLLYDNFKENLIKLVLINLEKILNLK